MSASTDQDLMAALAPLKFQFELDAALLGPERRRGYGQDAIIEIVGSDPEEVTLVVAAPSDRRNGARAIVYLLTVAGALGVDFADWLCAELWRDDRSLPWRRSRMFGSVRVSAELATAEAVIVTISFANGCALSTPREALVRDVGTAAPHRKRPTWYTAGHPRSSSTFSSATRRAQRP